MRLFKNKKTAAICLSAAMALALCGCGGKPFPDDAVIDIPGVTGEAPAATEDAGETAPAVTDEAEPTADTLEARVLSGEALLLNGGNPLTSGFEAVELDIDGDGAKERLSIETVDGGDTFCIDGEAFMEGGLIVSVASLEGERMVFVTQKPGEEGCRYFYPDEGGNLYCRLFGIERHGGAGDFTRRASYEEYVKNGLDIMLHNPLIYSQEEGQLRTVRLDMDGDGTAEEIVFDSALLTVNGQPNARILTTTMPRFTYDAEHGAIVIYGSAGDLAIRLRFENGALTEDASYAELL